MKSLFLIPFSHLFQIRIIPAIKSKIPKAKNIKVRRGEIDALDRRSTSIKFKNIRRINPTNSKLVNIRKPPIATLSLAIFRIIIH